VDSCALLFDQLVPMIKKRGTRIHSTAKLQDFGDPCRRGDSSRSDFWACSRKQTANSGQNNYEFIMAK